MWVATYRCRSSLQLPCQMTSASVQALSLFSFRGGLRAHCCHWKLSHFMAFQDPCHKYCKKGASAPPTKKFLSFLSFLEGPTLCHSSRKVLSVAHVPPFLATRDPDLGTHGWRRQTRERSRGSSSSSHRVPGEGCNSSVMRFGGGIRTCKVLELPTLPGCWSILLSK